MPDAPTADPKPNEGAPDPYPKPRPEGEPPPILKLREMIETQLAEMMSGYLADQSGAYIVGAESARIFVVPAWIPDGPSVVRVFAITNVDVPITAELTSYLLTTNLEFVFGAFALDVSNGAVWFNHNLLGDHTSPEELEATIGAVAQTADKYDDEIKARFGGRLYVEAPRESLPTPPAPGYL
ncbi:MAG: hypothetical protein QOH26_1521 [Actinomycetota bacterium]|jgi:hypothetical protein|nr:hypothetical protein [Actinomycetota bacterium]